MRASEDAVISAEARGEVIFPPDSAAITVSAEASEDWSGDALSKVSRIISDIKTMLFREYSIHEDDIETAPAVLFSSGEEDDRWKGKTFSARQSIRIMLHDTERTGPVYTGLSRLSGIEIGTPVLFRKDAEPFLDEARRKAVKEAVRKAGIIAEAAGVKIKGIKSIKEVECGTSAAGGKLKASADIKIVFELI